MKSSIHCNDHLAPRARLRFSSTHSLLTESAESPQEIKVFHSRQTSRCFPCKSMIRSQTTLLETGKGYDVSKPPFNNLRPTIWQVAAVATRFDERTLPAAFENPAKTKPSRFRNRDNSPSAPQRFAEKTNTASTSTHLLSLLLKASIFADCHLRRQSKTLHHQ